jgi:hypothetical protein
LRSPCPRPDGRKNILKIWKSGGRSSTKATRRPGLNQLERMGSAGDQRLWRLRRSHPNYLGADDVASALLREPRLAGKVNEVYSLVGRYRFRQYDAVANLTSRETPSCQVFFSGMHITLIGLERTTSLYFLGGVDRSRSRTSDRYCFDNFDPGSGTWLGYT